MENTDAADPTAPTAPRSDTPANSGGFLGAMGFATEEAPAATPDGAASNLAGPTQRQRVRKLVMAAVAGAVILPTVLYGPTACQVMRQQGTTLATPNQVAGLSLYESDSARDTTEYLRTAVSAKVPFDKTIGAIYVGQEGVTRGVIVVGGTGTLWSPDKYMKRVFNLITDEQGGVEAIHDESPGPLGGVMQCGTTTADNITMTVCAWADHGSLAVALFADRGVEESARLLRDMRAAMQHR